MIYPPESMPDDPYEALEMALEGVPCPHRCAHDEYPSECEVTYEAHARAAHEEPIYRYLTCCEPVACDTSLPAADCIVCRDEAFQMRGER